MKRSSIAIAVALLAAGSANAAALFSLSATNPVNVAGSVSTVTATLTVDGAGVVIPALGTIALQVGWDMSVVRVVGTTGQNPPTTFGKSSESALLTTSAGTITPGLMPGCVSAGVNKGKACTIMSQSSVGGATVDPNQVVIGTLLLEVLGPPGGPDPFGITLGLIVTNYNNAGITNPADPSLTINASFTNAQIVPEPSTAALLALGLMSLCAGARRRDRRTRGGAR